MRAPFKCRRNFLKIKLHKREKEKFYSIFFKNRRGGGDRVPSSCSAEREILSLRGSAANSKQKASPQARRG